MKYLLFIILLALPSILSYEKLQPGCDPKTYEPLDIDLGKYTGRWYEIMVTQNAREKFEKDCSCVYAEYGLLSKTKISVDNECWRDDLQERQGIQGSATAYGPGSLDVKFFMWQFWLAPYQVVYMEGNYDLVVVVSCSPYRENPIFASRAEDFVWILSRTPVISEKSKEKAFEYLEQHNFSVNSLVKTQQTGQECQDFHKGIKQ